jgi:hypothetical protein
MLRLTLRTLLAYIDDTLEPTQARELGEKVAASDDARDLIDKIKRVTRRRGLKTPVPTGKDDTVSDANTVAEYLSDTLDPEGIEELEATCLKSDVHLAEVAACHQILTLVLTEPVRVPPQANQRMYKLVEPPASIPTRKPGKTVPVGGMPTRPSDHPDHDDPDAPLLLGMRRYSASESWATRVGLVGAVVALALLLVVAVLMALPHGQTQTPPTRETAAVTTPPPNQQAEQPKPPGPSGPGGAKASGAGLPGEPMPPEELPEGVAPPPRRLPDPVGDAAGKAEPKVDGKPGAVLVGDVPDPIAIRERIGQMVTPNVIVVSRSENAPAWLRLTPDGDPLVMTADTVLCLPGYKADVQLDSGVTVHLWGTIPVLLADPVQPDARLRADVRVRFHAPPRDFDADFTLLAGRVYLGSRKAGGARIRVRASTEVWDITLPDEKTDVMVEAITGFAPGTAYAQGRGEGPRTDVRAVVLRGTAGIRAPKRPKDFPKVAAPAVVSWNNKGGRLSDPELVKDEEMPRYVKFPLVDAKEGAEAQKLLNETAARLTDKDGLKAMLTERLTEAPKPPMSVQEARAQFLQLLHVILAQAAALTVDPQPNGVRLLIDRLREQTRGFARLPAIVALSYWSAQAPGNSELLYRQLVDESGFSAEDADLIIRLLRGYMPPGRPRGEDLDALVGMLNHPSVAIRELALWNLMATAFPVADPDAVRQSGLAGDVGETDNPEYERFVRRWKTRVEEIKKGPKEPIAPKPIPPKK